MTNNRNPQIAMPAKIPWLSVEAPQYFVLICNIMMSHQRAGPDSAARAVANG